MFKSEIVCLPGRVEDPWELATNRVRRFCPACDSFLANFLHMCKLRSSRNGEFPHVCKRRNYNLWIFERNWCSQWCWIINKVNRLKAEGERDGRGRDDLDGITNSIDMNLSKLRELVKDRGARHASVHGITKSQTWLSNWTTTKMLVYLRYRFCFTVLQVKIGSEGDVISAAKIYDTAWFSHM